MRHLANDSGETLLAQALLHDGQHIALAKGFGIDHTVRMQARIHQARSKQVTTVQAPQHGTFQAGRNTGQEERCRSGELGSRSSLDHLMKRSKSEATLRKMAVDWSKGEGKKPVTMFPTFQALDLVPQISKHCLLPGTHAPCPAFTLFCRCSYYVLC
jgi:hypothetical protein